MVRPVFPAPGFAVVLAGVIQVNTVSATERTAKVNGLVAIFQMTILNRDSDAKIAEEWNRVAALSGAEIVPVEIGVAER